VKGTNNKLILLLKCNGKGDDPTGRLYGKMKELNEELEVLNSEARELEENITENISKLLP
jgi:hypothetical protein